MWSTMMMSKTVLEYGALLCINCALANLQSDCQEAIRNAFRQRYSSLQVIPRWLALLIDDQTGDSVVLISPQAQ